MPNAIANIMKHLYTPLHTKRMTDQIYVPQTRSVTLILRSFDGVAYTSGIPIDDLHKEMHLNLDYAARFLKDPSRFRDEMIGVVTHEMVHAYQWDARGTAPGGLIEGIADFVRLKAGLAPPHWKRSDVSEKWDEGYQRTAYFLEWLEDEYGAGSVARINERLRGQEYKEDDFWEGIFGKEKDVKWLFKRYRDSLKGKEEPGEKSEASDDGVLVELEDVQKTVMPERHKQDEDGSRL